MSELPCQATGLRQSPHGICPTVPQRALGNNVFSVGRMPIGAEEGRSGRVSLEAPESSKNPPPYPEKDRSESNPPPTS